MTATIRRQLCNAVADGSGLNDVSTPRCQPTVYNRESGSHVGRTWSAPVAFLILAATFFVICRRAFENSQLVLCHK